MTIILLVEGRTETACKDALKALLDEVAEKEGIPKARLKSVQYKGGEIHKLDVLQKDVRRHLGDPEVSAVVLLTDVCPRFRSPDQAKGHYAGISPGAKFRAHCALHDFEAWLLPYWQRVYKRAGKQPPRSNPWPSPESVDIQKPPSKVLREDLFGTPRGYMKTTDAPAILRGQNLRVAARACPELRLFLNSLLEFAGASARL